MREVAVRRWRSAGEFTGPRVRDEPEEGKARRRRRLSCGSMYTLRASHSLEQPLRFHPLVLLSFRTSRSNANPTIRRYRSVQLSSYSY